jgi:hypothetical protein
MRAVRSVLSHYSSVPAARLAVESISTSDRLEPRLRVADGFRHFTARLSDCLHVVTGLRQSRTDTLGSVMTALQREGIEFLDDGNPGVRVRMKK